MAATVTVASIRPAVSLYAKVIPECDPVVNNDAALSAASSKLIPVVVTPPAVVPLPTNNCPVVVSWISSPVNGVIASRCAVVPLRICNGIFKLLKFLFYYIYVRLINRARWRPITVI